MQPIRKELILQVPQEMAFNVFTREIDLWWPKTHHIGSSPMKEAVLEPKPAGRWYSIHEDGSEANVGKVLAWDPFNRVVLAWQINGNFKYDPELISEVEVCFIPEGPKTTRVTLEHRDLDKLMGGEKVIQDMDKGWGYIMNLYKEVTYAA